MTSLMLNRWDVVEKLEKWLDGDVDNRRVNVSRAPDGILTAALQDGSWRVQHVFPGDSQMYIGHDPVMPAIERLISALAHCRRSYA